MKRSFIMLSLLLLAAPMLRGQDSSSAASAVSRAESTENYNKLKGEVDLLNETKGAQMREIQELKAEIAALRVQLSKPQGNFASAEDVKTLADAIKEVDRKRIADNKELRSDVTDAIGKLGKTLVQSQSSQRPLTPAGGPPPTGKDKPDKSDKSTPTPSTDNTTAGAKPSDEGFWYEIKDGDSFRKIARAYTEQGVKVNWQDIAKANPTIKDTGLIVGKKLWIPAKPAMTANK